MHEFDVELKGDFFKRFQESTIALPVCVGARKRNGDDRKMKAHLYKIHDEFKTVKIVVTDTLYEDSIRCSNASTEQQQISLQAFEAGLQQFKTDVFRLVWQLNKDCHDEKRAINIEIIFWHQFVYKNFAQLSSNLFNLFFASKAVAGDVENASAVPELEEVEHRVNLWAEQVREIFKTQTLILDPVYQEYCQKTEGLITADQELESCLKQSVDKVKSRFTSRPAALRADKIANASQLSTLVGEESGNRAAPNEKNSDMLEQKLKDEAMLDYALKETAVYWMWGEQRFCDYTGYRAPIHEAMKYIQNRYLKNRLEHLQIKYPNKKAVKEKSRRTFSAGEQTLTQKEKRSQSVGTVPSASTADRVIDSRQVKSSPSSPKRSGSPTGSPPLAEASVAEGMAAVGLFKSDPRALFRTEEGDPDLGWQVLLSDIANSALSSETQMKLLMIYKDMRLREIKKLQTKAYLPAAAAQSETVSDSSKFESGLFMNRARASNLQPEAVRRAAAGAATNLSQPHNSLS